MTTALASKHKDTPGAPPPVSATVPTVDDAHAARLARYAKALSDPIRIQLVDVLAQHSGELCAGELLALFAVAKSTLSHHLKTLADADIIETRHQGTFAYYLIHPQALTDLADWLAQTSAQETHRAPQVPAGTAIPPAPVAGKQRARSI